VARPIPLAAPVITATFFSSLPIIFLRIAFDARPLGERVFLSIVGAGPTANR